MVQMSFMTVDMDVMNSSHKKLCNNNLCVYSYLLDVILSSVKKLFMVDVVCWLSSC